MIMIMIVMILIRHVQVLEVHHIVSNCKIMIITCSLIKHIILTLSLITTVICHVQVLEVHHIFDRHYYYYYY